MTTRFRQRQDWYGGYRTSIPDGSIDWSETQSVNSRTTDVVHQGDNQYFEAWHSYKSGGLINGVSGSTSFGYDFRNYMGTWQASDPAALWHNPIYAPSFTDMALDTIKRTNPNNAEADLGQDLAEMGEIPSLIRDSYKGFFDAFPPGLAKKIRNLGSRVALLNILYQFGYAPLIDDTKKMLEFPKAVERRIKELERLQAKKGLRRTIELFSDCNVTQFNATIQSSGVFINTTITKSTRMRIRGHIRWYPLPPILRRDHSVLDDAIRTVAGNEWDIVTIYNIIPWTWLADYFTNLGDLIQLNRNTVECYHEPVRIITHVLTETICAPWTNGVVTMTPIKNSLEETSRMIAVPTLSARQQFLTEKQTSIISSLAVLKGPKLGRIL